MPLPRFTTHLAVFGTASDVGKSLLCAAFGRLLADADRRVAPFKAQNMSNNAFVTRDGGEIGRAQYVQAVACRVEPSVHHNPVLLKPSADDLSQVVVHGRVVRQSRATEYFRDTAALRTAAYSSFDRLAASHEVVLLEGAGSCAEVNLRAREFVNFPAAHHARAHVVLVADIDRGGVFAQVVGSLEVMPPEDRARVRGVVVNKFRGDLRLFDDGVAYLEARTGVPVLGVVPYLYGLDLDAEDAVPVATVVDPPAGTDAERVRVGVLKLPHISNFTDFDALARVGGLAVHYLYRARDLSDYAAIIVPGSKSVVSDLEWLRATGVAERLLEYHAKGGRVLGVCGGFQMLGRSIVDPHGVESSVPRTEGLGLVPARTVFLPEKIVRQISGVLQREGIAVEGYEIHCGRTEIEFGEPLLRLADGTGDGVRQDALWGTYAHGLFDHAAFREHFLRWIAPGATFHDGGITRQAWIDAELDRFAAHVRRHVDWPTIESWTLGAGPATDEMDSYTLECPSGGALRECECVADCAAQRSAYFEGLAAHEADCLSEVPECQ